MPTDHAGLDEQDRALLGRLADRILELRLETPAVLTLETAKPMSVIAGQGMLFFEPIVQAMFGLGDYRRIALLIEQRPAIEALIQMIEARADADQKARREAAASRRERDRKTG